MRTDMAFGIAGGRRRPRLTWLVLLLLLLMPVTAVPATSAASGPPSAAAVTFQVTYAAGVPQQARDAFAASTAVWAPLLNSTVPIQISVTWTALGNCNQGCTLAAAGPTDMIQNFPNAPRQNTLYPIALANSIAGSKQNQGADITADFNSQVNWFYGAGTPPQGQNSFTSTAVHELAHGLGFTATLDLNTQNGQGNFGATPNIFDRFVVNGAGQTLVDSFPNNSTALAAQLTGGSVFFNGTNAKAAAGGTNPKLFAPNPWQVGSSISHLDQATYANTPNALMTASDESGGLTAPGPITEAIFKDLGWPGSTQTGTCGQRFRDVNNANPACTAIEGLAARGVINGCFTDPTTQAKDFCPTESTLRHQMAALIVRAIPAWVGETGLPTFGDNTDDNELMTRVATLQRHGVVRGYQAAVCLERNIQTPPGCYGPLDTVKYGQVLLFIARAMEKAGYWTLQPDDRTIFPDQNGAVGADPNTDQQTLDHRYVVTYVKNVGNPPDVANVNANFAFTSGQGWADASSRAWFARAFWPAIKDR